MKKHFTLFFVYCSIVFTGICLFLVFYSNNSQNNSAEEFNEEVKPTYATKLALNCARTIKMKNNTSIELLNGFLDVQPKEKVEEVEIEIVNISGSSKGLSVNENIINSHNLGEYKIKFKVAQSATKFLTDQLTINVVVDLDPDIIVNKHSLYINEIISINDMFNVNSTASNYTIETSENLNFENGIFIAKSSGTSKVTFTYDFNYIRRSVSYIINIKELPLYEIILIDVSSNSELTDNEIFVSGKEGTVLFLQYEIKNRKEENISQAIVIDYDENSVQCVVTEPLIKIKLLNKGKIVLTIIYSADNNVFRQVIINFT